MSVNQAFVKAISTIKTLTRSPNLLGKPPLENKTVLYGLYKQATEGDVQGIMPRPTGQSPQDRANQRKWDAWKNQEGLSRDEAKIRYIEYLLETMRQVSPDTPQSRALLGELNAIYLAAKNDDAAALGLPSGSSGPVGPVGPGTAPPHQRTWSSSSSAYGQFLRRPTHSEFGLSVGDRTERMSEMSDLPNDPGIHAPEGSPGGIAYGDPAWQNNVAWQLDTISEEINSIRRRYDPPVLASPHSLRRTSHTSLDQHASPGYGLAPQAPQAPGAPQAPQPPHAPAPRDPTSWSQAVRRFFAALVQAIRRLFSRVAVDLSALTLLLIVIRVVRSSPKLMSQIPFTRRAFTVAGNVVAVVLREVGFEIKPR